MPAKPVKVRALAHRALGFVLPSSSIAASVATVAWLAMSGCGPKQVCECAVLGGGTAPASDAEAASRSSAVARCLAQHGGGTTTGCPQPAGMPRALTPRQPAPPGE